MALSAQFSLLHSDLNYFLFAPVGAESNGMPLSVVSALTRLGLDPWEEAARLAALPKKVAAEVLAPMIARLPIGRSGLTDDLVISQRLVELLPTPKRAGGPVREPVGAKHRRHLQVLILFACFALAAAVLSSLL
jgi:hypothetical protein